MEEKIVENKECCNNHSLIKIIASTIFIMLPFLGFYLGTLYQQSQVPTTEETNQTIIKKISQNQPPQSQTYSKPSTWKTANMPVNNISLCLPPKWEIPNNPGRTIVFNRDPSYKPDVAYITSYKYKGGSRREEFINLKTQYEPDLKNKAKVSDININEKEVLKILIPSMPEALVFVLNNRIYEVGLSNWNLVNDSESAFLNDIYTLISCIRPL